nr:MAG TPA: Malignant T-cell-amplified sequence 1, Density-regulated initiation, Ribosome, TRANSLATION [Caudoviricetes sp.]
MAAAYIVQFGHKKSPTKYCEHYPSLFGDD